MNVDRPSTVKSSDSDRPAVKPFVFVLGVPSGGTSCVAHVLRHLGIDMGRIPNELAPHGRDYSTCEDRDCFALAVNQFAPWGRPLPAAEARKAAELTARYVERRRQQATSSQVLGCKGWVNWAAVDECFWQIPEIQVVRVHRQLDVCIESFLRYQRMAPKQRKRDLLRHAAFLAVQWTIAHHLIEARPQIFELDFDCLCHRPSIEINRLLKWLPMEPTEQAVQRAIAQVREPKTKIQEVINVT